MAGAGYLLFTAGQILTAAQVNTYLNQQTIMVFASASARNTALSAVLSEGLTAYLLDVNALTVYSGAAWSTVGPVHGAWTAYTPTWSGTIGNGTLVGAYQRVGRTIAYRASVTWGSTTTHAAANQSLSVPVTPAVATLPSPIGTGSSLDAGAAAYSEHVFSNGTTTTLIGMGISQATSLGHAFVSNTVPFTWANTDALYINGTYEAAADA